MRAPISARFAAFQLPSLPEADLGDSLKDASKMLGDLEQQLGKLRHHFKKLQSRQDEDGGDLHELSQGIKAMADNPMNAVLGTALAPVTDGLQALATHTKRQASVTKGTLLAKLKLHRYLALAIIEQFKAREKLGKDVDALNGKIKDLLNQSTKLAGKQGKEKQIADLETKAADLQRQVTDQRTKYTTLSQTLSWELERYNKNKNREIITSLQEFAINFTEFTSKQNELWGHLSAGVMQTAAAAALWEQPMDSRAGAAATGSGGGAGAAPPASPQRTSYADNYGASTLTVSAAQEPTPAHAPTPAAPPTPTKQTAAAPSAAVASSQGGSLNAAMWASVQGSGE